MYPGNSVFKKNCSKSQKSSLNMNESILKVLTNEKRGGLAVVSFDRSPFKLFLLIIFSTYCLWEVANPVIYQPQELTHLKWQRGQKKGFSPVWTLMCRSSFFLEMNFLLQSAHRKSNAPLWRFSQVISSFLYLKKSFFILNWPFDGLFYIYNYLEENKWRSKGTGSL